MSEQQQIDVGTTLEASGVSEAPEQLDREPVGLAPTRRLDRAEALSRDDLVVVEADEIRAGRGFRSSIEATAQGRKAAS